LRKLNLYEKILHILRYICTMKKKNFEDCPLSEDEAKFADKNFSRFRNYKSLAGFAYFVDFMRFLPIYARENLGFVAFIILYAIFAFLFLLFAL